MFDTSVLGLAIVAVTCVYKPTLLYITNSCHNRAYFIPGLGYTLSTAFVVQTCLLTLSHTFCGHPILSGHCCTCHLLL